MAKRATISVWRPGAKQRAALWFEDWKDELTYVSSNQGCGCCTDLFDVEGSDEAIDRIPPLLGPCQSAWASGGGERPPEGKVWNPYLALLRAPAGPSRR